MISARRTVPTLLLAAIVLLAGCATVEESIEDEVDERVQENVDEGVEKTADEIEGGIENAVKCAVGDEECIEEAQEDGETVVLTDEDGNVKRDENGDPVTASDRAESSDAEDTTERQGEELGETNPNYDFEPGERTIFAEDFSDDNVGDFPRNLEFRQGSMEIVDTRGERLLRMNSDGSTFHVNLPEELPERFTIQLKFYAGYWVNNMSVTFLDDSGEAVGGNYIQVGGGELGVAAHGDGMNSIKDSRRGSEQVVPIRVMVDGSYAKAYMGRERFANIPNADIARTSTIRFRAYRIDKENMYVGDIRIAGGGRDLYSALQAEGRVAVQDIRFDTGEATLKPESDETLKEVASLLQEHPELDLLIEGHTDNTGDFDANKTLSEERAQAVKAALVEDYSIEAGRLKTVGLGSTQPKASNDTEEDRAENRRVELVKQ